MKIVLDSNVLLVCIGKRSPFRPIWNGFLNKKFHLVITASILLEYEEILQTKSATGVSDLVIKIFKESPNVDFINTYYHWSLIEEDGDDNKFCDAAIAGQVDFLVTNDKHFEILKHIPFPFIKTITAEDFLKIIQ